MAKPEAELWVQLGGGDVIAGTIYAPRLEQPERADAGSSPNHYLP